MPTANVGLNANNVLEIGADRVVAGESGGKAMSRIYGNIGFKGLWNGLPVRIAMVCALVYRLP